jgi:hypothetical protein
MGDNLGTTICQNEISSFMDSSYALQGYLTPLHAFGVLSRIERYAWVPDKELLELL